MHIFFGEQRFGRSDHFAPALTCRHLANKNAYPRQQPNNWFRGADANKEKRGRGGQEKAPTTPVKTHLGASKNSSQDPDIAALQIIVLLRRNVRTIF